MRNLDSLIKSGGDPYLTVPEVAAMFAVQPYTVREWLRDDRMHGIKLMNSRWRIRLSEVQKFANEKYG